jgi:hypothetical protein
MSGPEGRIQKAIQAAVVARKGYIFKIHGSDTMEAGLPDLICCYRGQFVAFEVKTPSTLDNVSPKQAYVHQKIRRAGGICAVPASVGDAMAVLDAIDRSIDLIG